MSLAALKRDWDVVVVGAGPAGLAAATLLADGGAEVLLLDEQPEPGGQIYRGVERNISAGNAMRAVLGDDYFHGAELVRRFRRSAAVYAPRANVWRVAQDRRIYASDGAVSKAFQARCIVLATGAIERPVAIPGWTLPGVMTAGALQILLKTSGLVPTAPTVLAGTGPLFYLVAQQALAAGANVVALLDTQSRGNILSALRSLPAAVTGEGPSYLLKGLRLKSKIRASNCVVYSDVSNVVVEGEGRAEAVSFSFGARKTRLAAQCVALHEGVIPAQQVTRSVGCAHQWDPVQRAFKPVLDSWGASSVEGILVAGDGGGIGGARAAEHGGRVAALDVLRRLSRIDAIARDTRARDDRIAMTRHLAVRPFLDRLFAPRAAAPGGQTIVCRCEEVTAGAVTDLAAAGLGPNQVKSFLRCGMGPCQGRLCGPVVSDIIAQAQGLSPAEVGYYHVRTPLKPLTLGELSTLSDD